MIFLTYLILGSLSKTIYSFQEFSGKHVVFITQRRILPKPRKANKLKQKRPCSPTLVDCVYSAEIVG